MFRRPRSWCWLALGLLGTIMSSGGVVAQEAAPAVDLYGDPLPAGSIARLGTVRYRHGGWQRSFLFAPDGKTLMSAADGGSLGWFNAADGKLIRRLDVEDRPFGTIAFAPGGRTFASAGRLRWTDKGAGLIRLWDFDTGKAIRAIPYGDKVEPKFLVFTPDGKTLLTAGERYDSDIRIFDVASADELLTYKLSSKGIGAMALSPDGNLVAVAEEHGDSIYLWEWQTSNKPRRLAAKLERGANFLAFSPDGRMLISSGDDRRGLCFWDVARGSLLGAEIVGDSSCSVRRAAFSSDGRLLATALSYYESRPDANYSTGKSGVFLWETTTLSPEKANKEKGPRAKLLCKIPVSALDLAIASD